MLGPEPLGASVDLHGLRVVAQPDALDAARWAVGTIVIRIAADEALAIGTAVADLDDVHAIVEPETAFVGWWLSQSQVDDLRTHHIEWTLPTDRPALGQGRIAGVPLKLWLDHDRALLIASRGLVHEVLDRLGPQAGRR